jgi:hypothetical protein
LADAVSLFPVFHSVCRRLLHNLSARLNCLSSDRAPFAELRRVVPVLCAQAVATTNEAFPEKVKAFVAGAQQTLKAKLAEKKA